MERSIPVDDSPGSDLSVYVISTRLLNAFAWFDQKALLFS